MATDNITNLTTHDLWIEARQFDLDIERPTPTTILLTIKRPANVLVTDGAALVISTTPINANTYPEDGQRYVANTAWGAVGADMLEDAQVVGFWSKILNQPFPAGTPEGDKLVWTVTVTNTDPDTIYYASVHACTNVLQYYPIGVQSYPLESSRIEKDSFTYTGNIPNLPHAPTNPVNGFVYYDQQLNIVQYWDGAKSAWIPTRADSIISGSVNPGVIGQTYMYTLDGQLRVFNGKDWVKADSTNFQMLGAGATWIPLGVVTRATQFPTAPAFGDMFYSYTSRNIQYWDGNDWVVPTSTNTLFDSLSGWVPAFTTPFSIEPAELITPYNGLLFYNTTTRLLMVFNGTGWIQANTDQQGTPTTDKVGIGSDGSYDERLRLIKILKAQLGYPIQCVELNEEHFNIAIDNALDTYRQLSGGAYERRFILYTMLPDQQTYYLNSPVDRTDRIVQIMRIHRLNILGSNTLTGENNVYFQTFLNQYYSSGQTDILSIHLMHSLSEEFHKIFAGEFTFQWNEARREMTVLRRVPMAEKVVLECFLERSEQELLLDRWAKQWLQGWAMAECKEMLGLIRSKYTSGTPGPGGSITLNGDMLLSEARQDFTDLRQQMFDYEVGNMNEVGNVAFMWG